jgi:hypothetical protein
MRRWQAMAAMGLAASSYAVVTPLVKLAANSHVPRCTSSPSPSCCLERFRPGDATALAAPPLDRNGP